MARLADGGRAGWLGCGLQGWPLGLLLFPAPNREFAGELMVEVGTFLSRSCEGTTRRSFLKTGLSVPLAFGLPELSRVLGAPSPKASSVLLVWLGGGPSHLDLFDPKPKAPLEYRGPFTAIGTKTPGVFFTELLPKLAQRSDHFS
jgi:hypothetical protein